MLPRSVWRSLRVGEHLLTGALLALYFSARGDRSGELPKVVRWWHRRLCRVLGLRLEVSGGLQPGCLLIGNHVSWLDIPVLGAQGELGFLSKAEVRGWPLVGWMAEIAGTHFIARGSHQADEVRARLVEQVRQGHTLLIFPEGTTSDGRLVRRFHPRLLAVAQSGELRIQPVAIGYRHGDDPTPDVRVPFVGEDTLIANLWRVIRHPDLVAHVHFLPPIQAGENEGRRSLAERARLAIVEALGLDPQLDAETVAVAPVAVLGEGDVSVLVQLDPNPV